MAFSRVNSTASPAGSAFNAAMILSRTGWWMMSSALPSAVLPISRPRQPPSGEQQRAAADERHPQHEMLAQQEEAAEGERGDGDSGGRVTGTEPDAPPDLA